VVDYFLKLKAFGLNDTLSLRNMSDDGGGTDRAEIASLAVAVVALVVALVALFGTTAQVFQQYLATAVGYSNCGKRIMGPWARHTKLVFHPWELRFEVVFRSPEISVVSSIPGITGLFNAVDDITHWDLPESQPAEKTRDQGEKTAVADYSATWLALLSTVRDMEHQSRPPPDHGRIRVKVQAKIQTLDLMPEGVKKPYATTTLSSIIHLAAMMGIHWKEFDRRGDRYIADGNGLLLTGSAVPHLGIMFTFTRHGFANFGQTVRVIPTVAITEFCFGLVPTILRRLDVGKLIYLVDAPRHLSTLRLGSTPEIARTLALLGCDKDTVTFLSSSEHVFPGEQNTRHANCSGILPNVRYLVIFELVGMLGRKVRPRGSPFRTLPNPLPYRWDTTAFSPLRLLYEFIGGIASDDVYNELVPGISEKANLIPPSLMHQHHQFHDFESNPPVPDHLHATLDWCDEWLKPRDSKSNQELITVICVHFETVAKHLGQGNGEPQEEHRIFTRRMLSQLTAGYSEERERLLMAFYFGVILPRMREELLPRTKPKKRGAGPDAEDLRAAAVWLVLMLRMLCWLNLHTFHPGDVQVPKSDLMGTRLPVYIS